MVADTPLGRSPVLVVLHAESGEDLHRAVIHLGWNGYLEDALGMAQDRVTLRIETDLFRHDVQLLASDRQLIEVFACTLH